MLNMACREGYECFSKHVLHEIIIMISDQINYFVLITLCLIKDKKILTKICIWIKNLKVTSKYQQIDRRLVLE